eukprot:13336636-Heterocapsa_arctica.AAC.1
MPSPGVKQEGACSDGATPGRPSRPIARDASGARSASVASSRRSLSSSKGPYHGKMHVDREQTQK